MGRLSFYISLTNGINELSTFLFHEELLTGAVVKMTSQIISPYGSWISPITTGLVSSNSMIIEEIKVDGEDLYWLEKRPDELGRQVIVHRSPNGRIRDITPGDYNVRNRVHEYGGGVYQVSKGTIYFTNYFDQRIYCQDPDNDPKAITPVGDFRYADLALDEPRHRLICIREHHLEAGSGVINELVSISLSDPYSIVILASGNDFYSNPRLSPDKKQIAWLTWNHPNMPWDGTELWLAELDLNGDLIQPRLIAGGKNESIFQPEWSPAGTLHFISDRTGWWNLYRWLDPAIEPLMGLDAEFGLPQWVFGLSTYGFSGPNEIICTYKKTNHNFLARLDLTTGILTNIETPFVDYSYICAKPGQVIFVCMSSHQPARLMLHDLKTGSLELICEVGTSRIEQDLISIPRNIQFPSYNGLPVHANIYLPFNKNHLAPRGEKPPLIVILHGGPTSSAATSFNLGIQFWTSRGFALLDVNYSGSSGFGRDYRQRLDGNWGIIDVEDCVNGAKYLASQGLVNPERMVISGRSAGGFTALCALTFHNIFTAGVIRYGIGSLESLAEGTDKFEMHYLDRLVGPYPEAQEIYKERSPIHFIDQIHAAILLMHGTEDRLVPPQQSERMYRALDKKGIPVAYVPFEGEQHGFRKSSSIQRSLEVEYYFYSRIFNFPLTENIQPIEIKNLVN